MAARVRRERWLERGRCAPSASELEPCPSCLAMDLLGERETKVEEAVHVAMADPMNADVDSIFRASLDLSTSGQTEDQSAEGSATRPRPLSRALGPPLSRGPSPSSSGRRGGDGRRPARGRRPRGTPAQPGLPGHPGGRLRG